MSDATFNALQGREHGHGHGHDHQEGHIGPKTYFVIYFVLMGLMTLTVIAALFDLGSANFGIAMGIAGVKTILIILYFMHVRYSEKLTWVYSIGAIFWFILMVGGFLNDYFFRGYFVPGK